MPKSNIQLDTVQFSQKGNATHVAFYVKDAKGREKQVVRKLDMETGEVDFNNCAYKFKKGQVLGKKKNQLIGFGSLQRIRCKK